MRTVRCSSHLGGGGVCLPRGGVCWGVSVQGGVCPGGVSAGGCLSRWGVSAQVGGVCPGGVSDTHTPVNRITDACESITLPQLRWDDNKE